MDSDRATPSLPPVDPSAAGADAGTAMTPELLAGLLADGDDELAAWALANALEQLPREQVYDGLLRDAMALIGARWRDGSWGIAEEHAATQALTRALDRLAPPRGPLLRVGPVALVAGVRDERHTLGLVCLAHILEEAGWSVVNLGGDEPADDLARFAAQMQPALVGLTASNPERAEAVAEAVGALRAVPLERPLTVILGGRFATDEAAVAGLAVDWAGTSLVEAADFASRLAERLVAEGWATPPRDVF
jgi:methanogenic corrinoid protein MtbC1